MHLRMKKSGLYLMIPMSSRVDKYRKIAKEKESKKKPCDILHICKLDNGKESVFLIQDIFPVSEKYILRPYTICQNHLRLTSEAQARVVRMKATKVLGMLRRGIRLNPTQPDIFKIEKTLLL